MHDLSHPIHDGMSTYPAPYHPRVEVTQLGTLERDGRESRRIVLGSHSGTHVDAASHFVPGGRTIDAVPLDVLVGPARVIRLLDVRPGTAVPADRLARELGDARSDRVILRFDWSTRWGTPEFYSQYPFLSREACRLLTERGVRLLGHDTPSCDDPKESGPSCDPDSPNHKHLLGAGVTLVEYLTNLAAIERDEVELIAIPLGVRGGDGAPARVVAIER